MVKKAKTAEQNQKELEELTERVFTQFQSVLNAKGYELVKYLDGEIDRQTSNTAREVLIKAVEKAGKELMKGNWAYEPDFAKMMKHANVSIVFMCEGEAIPDWVVKQIGQSGQTYSVLIETTKGVIEISDSVIAKEIEDLAQKWEDERKIFVSTPSFDPEHFGYTFSEEVSIVENY